MGEPSAPPSSSQPLWLPSPLTAFVVVTYFFLSMFLNYFNSYLLGGGVGQRHLQIPVFYCFVQQIAIVTFTSLWCAIVPAVRFPIWDTFRDNWRWLIFLSVFFSLSIAAHNVAFASISLTVVTIFTSSVPFPLMIFSAAIEGKRYSVPVICIVAVLVGGTLLAVPWTPQPHLPTQPNLPPMWVGYAMVVVSTVATAMLPVVSAYLMRSVESSGSRHALSALSMAWFNGAIALPILGVSALVAEVYARPGVQETYTGAEAYDHAALTLVGCVAAGFYAPVTFYTIKLTSSLSFAIIGNFKQIVLLLFAALLVDHVTDPMLWGGVVVVGLSSVAYSYQVGYEKRVASDAVSRRESLIPQKGVSSEATPLRTSV